MPFAGNNVLAILMLVMILCTAVSPTKTSPALGHKFIKVHSSRAAYINYHKPSAASPMNRRRKIVSGRSIASPRSRPEYHGEDSADNDGDDIFNDEAPQTPDIIGQFIKHQLKQTNELGEAVAESQVRVIASSYIGSYRYDWLGDVTDSSSDLYFIKTRLHACEMKATSQLNTVASECSDAPSPGSENNQQQEQEEDLTLPTFYLCYADDQSTTTPVMWDQVDEMTDELWSIFLNQNCAGMISGVSWNPELIPPSLIHYAPALRVFWRNLPNFIRIHLSQLDRDQLERTFMIPLDPSRILRQIAPALNVPKNQIASEPQLYFDHPQADTSIRALTRRYVIVPYDRRQKRRLTATPPITFRWGPIERDYNTKKLVGRWLFRFEGGN